MPSCADLGALNAWLEQRCIELWAQIPHGGLPGTVADVWADERANLMPLSRPFDGFAEYAKRVSQTCLVHLERTRYSVPASFANRPVSVRVYPERIVVAAEGQILREHQRIIERSHNQPPRTVHDWRHYLAVIQRKPGALRIGAPFFIVQAARGRLAEGGRIINISSAAATKPVTAAPIYSMAKAAINNLTHALASELGPRGITANAVAGRLRRNPQR